MNERCGTCKHWDDTHDDWRSGLTLMLKEGEKHDDRYDASSAYQQRTAEIEKQYGVCKEIGLLEGGEEVDGDDPPLAYTKDGSDYKATLYTKNDFGCVEWERKPDGD